MHVHLREPGQEEKETIATGTRAAAAGGITAVAAMPNTLPTIDTEAQVNLVLARAQATGAVRVYAIGAMTKGRMGEVISEMADMRRAGAVAVSDDGAWLADAAVARRAMEYASMLGLPVISHAEESRLAQDGAMNEGFLATRLGLKGIPAAAEEIAIARDLRLAELTGARLHIAHVSTRGSVELIRVAKAKGIAVTAEVTPHHLILTEERVEGYDTDAKVSPPLRTSEDIGALRAGLADGTIDVVATDHAPHTAEEKAVEFSAAPTGFVGLETALALLLDRLVGPGTLSLGTLVERFSLAPAKILGVETGRIAPGGLADLTLIDLSLKRTVDKRSFRSKGRNTPFDGWELTGWPVGTMVGGKLVISQGEVLA
jgi:dihydroorotase